MISSCVYLGSRSTLFCCSYFRYSTILMERAKIGTLMNIMHPSTAASTMTPIINSNQNDHTGYIDTGRWRGSDAGFVLKHFQLFWGCLMLTQATVLFHLNGLALALALLSFPVILYFFFLLQSAAST